jgi:ATP-dependent DNA ligase
LFHISYLKINCIQRDAEEDRIRKLLKASTTEYQKASRYLITAAMKNGKISLNEAAYLSDCQRAALGTVSRRTPLMDICNHTYMQHGNGSVSAMSLNGSFKVCLKADDVMKKTEMFFRKMQMDNPL